MHSLLDIPTGGVVMCGGLIGAKLRALALHATDLPGGMEAYSLVLGWQVRGRAARQGVMRSAPTPCKPHHPSPLPLPLSLPQACGGGGAPRWLLGLLDTNTGKLVEVGQARVEQLMQVRLSLALLRLEAAGLGAGAVGGSGAGRVTRSRSSKK